MDGDAFSGIYTLQFIFARLRRGSSFGGQDNGPPTARPLLPFLAGAALVLLFFALPLCWKLGAFDLDNDEAIYSHAALSVSQHGAWLSPWSSPSEVPFLEKPPLKIWLVALGQLAGLPPNELGLRFFDPLFGALALLYLYALGCRAGGPRFGPLAGVAAAATLFLFAPLVFEHGLRSNNMEAALLLAYCGGAWHLLAWQRAPGGSAQSRGQLIAATLFFTFGFLVKFVAALFLPFAALAAVLLDPSARRRLGSESGLLLAAAGIFTLLAAPWFVLQHFENGANFWRVIFGQHVVERFTHHLDPGHLHPFGYYFATIAGQLREAGTLPWVLLGLAAWLYATWRERSFFGLFVLLWGFLPLLAISFGSSKLLHYAYPFLPPLALFAGFAAAKLVEAVDALAATRPRPAAALAAAVALALGGSLLAGKPASSYREILSRLDAPGDRRLMGLAACLAQGQARTLVDEGKTEPLVFVHAFQSHGIYHPLAFYSRKGAAIQQLSRPDEKLLFFRLYLPPHQAATLMPEVLWQSFRANLENDDFRAALLAQSDGLGARAEVARLLADPAGLPEPPGFVFLDWRYFLPGPYAGCLPP